MKEPQDEGDQKRSKKNYAERFESLDRELWHFDDMTLTTTPAHEDSKKIAG